MKVSVLNLEADNKGNWKEHINQLSTANYAVSIISNYTQHTN